MTIKALSAVVLGATGAVGTEVVGALMASPQFNQVITLGRRNLTPPNHPHANKLQHHVVDVMESSNYEPYLKGMTTALCTLGAGQPSKITLDALHKIDVECVAAFAGACKRQGIRHFTLMTAVDANPKARLSYLKFKGEIEALVMAQGFERMSFFRPSMLLTPKNRYGFLQGVMLKLFPILDPCLIGSLKRYRSIQVADLGLAMVRNAERPGQGVEILQWPQFKALLKD